MNSRRASSSSRTAADSGGTSARVLDADDFLSVGVADRDPVVRIGDGKGADRHDADQLPAVVAGEHQLAPGVVVEAKVARRIAGGGTS